MSSVFGRPSSILLGSRVRIYPFTSSPSPPLPCIPGPSRLPTPPPSRHTNTRSFTSTPLARKKRKFDSGPTEFTPPRPLSDDPALLPPGYTFYPHHSDKPNTPPTMANIITSLHPSPLLPRSSVFHYLFPPDVKGKKTRWYPAPNPKTVAFIDGLTGQEVTREQVGVQAQWLAAGLLKLGLKKGEVGMMFGFNSLLYVNAVMGMQFLGAIVSPANAAYAPDELLHQMSDSTAKIIFIQPQLLPTLDAALAKAKSSGSSYTLDPSRIILLCPKDAKPANSPYQTIEELWPTDKKVRDVRSRILSHGEESNTAYLCYSSGTTGRAKGVETTHHNMTSQVQAVRQVMEPLKAGKDRVLGILPFSHIYGLTLLIHYPLVVGVPIIVLPRFDEIQVLEVIQKYKITFGYVVPPVLIVLLNSKNVPKYDISSVRGFMSGAAPLSSDLANAVQEKLNIGVTQGYGLTETSPVSHVMTVEESLGRKGRIGKLMPTYQARLVTEDGKDVIKTGERGELWLRGPSVMKGYWRNEEATKHTFAEGGWFMTGDVAEIYDDGYFAIVDRVKELIKYKGFQVPPAELEALLLTHPKVADAAVIAYPSPAEATELPRAYVVPKAGLDSLKEKKDAEEFMKDVSDWVASKVANHKKLRGGVILIEAIPKSPSGKILRKDLRAMTKKEMEDKVKSGREGKL